MSSLLHEKGFRTLWIAQFVSIFGDFLALFGVISLITFRLHGTVIQVTYVTIAYMLPLAVTGPIAGVFVDRLNVKRLMIFSDLTREALALLLVFVTDIRQICGIFFAISVFSSFFGPAQTVTLRTIVATDKLLGANALMSQAFYLVRILSPAVAGALVAWLSEKACFYLDAGSFLFSATMLSTLTISKVVQRPSGKNDFRKFLSDFTEGNRFIFTHSSLAMVFSAMMTAMFILACFNPLISIYVRDSLFAGSFLFGVISSMVGVGLIVGTQLVRRIAADHSSEHVVVAGLVGLGIAVALLGLFHNIAMAGAGPFGLGLAIALVLVPAQTLMQHDTPREMLGRVSSSFMAVISTAQVLGMLLSGYLARILGIANLFKVSAIAVLVISAAFYIIVRARASTAPVPSS
jgi:MFS family permease